MARGVRSTSCAVLRALAHAAGSVTAGPVPPLLSPERVAPDSARMNAVHVGKRSSGFLASARATAGRSNSGMALRSGGSVMCWSASWRMFRPLNGFFPEISSQYTTARLYWSECRLTLLEYVSGAAYTGVTPPIRPELLERSSCLTRPKSATFTRSATVNRFFGFTSRCWRLCFSMRWSRPTAASSR